jgi:hypothetical protein
MRKQKGFLTHACAGQRSFGAGMATAYNNNIKIIWGIH